MESLREDPVLHYTAKTALETGKKEVGRLLVCWLQCCSVSLLITPFRKLGTISGSRFFPQDPTMIQGAGTVLAEQLHSPQRVPEKYLQTSARCISSQTRFRLHEPLVLAAGLPSLLVHLFPGRCTYHQYSEIERSITTSINVDSMAKHGHSVYYAHLQLTRVALAGTGAQQ
jgi:hypothetical protein